MTFRLLLLFTFIFFSNSILGQVNTESLRSSFDEHGHYQELNIGYNLTQGNTEAITLKALYRSDWVNPDYHTFLVADTKRSEGGGTKFADQGFIMLRTLKKLKRIEGIEAFYQKEFDKFKDLTDRELFGLGLRYKLKDAWNPFSGDIYFSNGVMLEYETLENNTDSDTLRSTNYVSYLLNITDKTIFNGTTYFQFDTSDVNDLRLLANLSINFLISETLAFQTSLIYRYDSRPPSSVETSDLSLDNALTISF